MVETKGKRRLTGIITLVGAIILIAVVMQTRCLTVLTSSSCGAIPTCDSCQLAVSPTSFAGNASGSFGPYTCSYFKAGMILTGPTQKEIAVPVPGSNSTYGAAMSIGFMPTSAKMCMYYRYGLFGVFTGCHPVPFVVH